nr:hypothetical protein [Tanacetum cinerariifolium]
NHLSSTLFFLLYVTLVGSSTPVRPSYAVVGKQQEKAYNQASQDKKNKEKDEETMNK